MDDIMWRSGAGLQEGQVKNLCSKKKGTVFTPWGVESHHFEKTWPKTLVLFAKKLPKSRMPGLVKIATRCGEALTPGLWLYHLGKQNPRVCLYRLWCLV